jgi:lipopolysaccharide/colanic/teichoic acid biosynthesis glycosyltransferase
MRPHVVVADEHDHPCVFRAAFEACRDDVAIAGPLEFHEHVFGRLPLAELQPSWFVTAVHLYRRPYGRISKRAFDIVVSLCALALTAPLFVVVALLVWRAPGPLLYKQTREGEFGRLFTIYKFRTMVVDAEADGSAVWARARDPRVTSAGRVLRRLRLDELPQLWNVLRGTMSVVGPRPERPELSAVLSSTLPFWSHRLLLKPGITGWAQVNDGYAADAAAAETKLSYDLWYLRHRSLLVDAAICLRTLSRLAAGSR